MNEMLVCPPPFFPSPRRTSCVALLRVLCFVRANRFSITYRERATHPPFSSASPIRLAISFCLPLPFVHMHDRIFIFRSPASFPPAPCPLLLSSPSSPCSHLPFCGYKSQRNRHQRKIIIIIIIKRVSMSVGTGEGANPDPHCPNAYNMPHATNLSSPAQQEAILLHMSILDLRFGRKLNGLHRREGERRRDGERESAQWSLGVVLEEGGDKANNTCAAVAICQTKRVKRLNG